MPAQDRTPDCVLFALEEEWKPFKAKRIIRNPGKVSPYWPVITGVGMRSTSSYLENRLKSTAFRSIIVCGFAGGLKDGLPPGSVIVPDAVTDTTSQKTYRVDSALLAVAESTRLSHLKYHGGLLATTDRVLIRAGEKRAFAEQTGAVAVDMESAGAARIAEEHKIPWLAVRAVTDSVNDDLPFDFNALADAQGNVNRRRIVVAALLRPWKIPALIRLGQRSSLAARNLADFLVDFLNRLPE